jgi:hypothetical protein
MGWIEIGHANSVQLGKGLSKIAKLYWSVFEGTIYRIDTGHGSWVN